MNRGPVRLARGILAAGSLAAAIGAVSGAATNKPVLHAKRWLAITGKPLAATAGAMTFQKGGNAVDAACAMLAATCTMWDTLGWGGETQALIFDPRLGKVIAINALGVAPTGATPEFFRFEEHGLPARIRAALRGDARHARRSSRHARRVREALARRCARSRDRGRTATRSSSNSLARSAAIVSG